MASFLRHNGIDYVYADPLHPNTFAPDATPIAEIEGTRLLRIP